MKRLIVSTLFVLSLALLSVGQTFAAPLAYIDPNTGGMIAQMLLVALAGLSGVFYFFKNRIVMFFNRLMRKEDKAIMEGKPETAEKAE